MEHNIDATNKKLGRLATEVAVLLMGKNTPDFAKNKVADIKINITNASKMDIDEKKLESKEYQRYSGYPGGRKIKKMSEVIGKKGFAEVLEKAVYGMLPTNKLRAKLMKNLVIEE